MNISDKIIRYLEQAREQESESILKMASGKEHAGRKSASYKQILSDKMKHKISSLHSSRDNIHQAISLLQTANNSMSEVANMINRLKEINISAASDLVSDSDRKFLLIEYQAIFDEIERISVTTEFQGIPLLNGESIKAPEKLVFRVSAPFLEDDEVDITENDINTVEFVDFNEVDTKPESLGLRSAQDLLEDVDDLEGIEIEDTIDLLVAENDDLYPTVFDEALHSLSTQRSMFSALESRLHYAIDFVDVYQENLEAASSTISETDYVRESANLLQATIRENSNIALLAQANASSKNTLQLIRNI